MHPPSPPAAAVNTAFLSQKATGGEAPRDVHSAGHSDCPVCRADLGRDDLSGLTLGQYGLGRRLGAGGMGLVYEAKHRHLGKSFAVKFIRNEVSGAEATARFLQEIRTLGTLQHLNIINAVDAGVEQHLPYCVTELLAGHDLGSWIQQRGPLPLGAAAEVVRQAADGLTWAHRQNVVHRDIKPSNLFLQFDGTVKLLDFGLSVNEGCHSSATEPGQLLGTVDFMSPEQSQNAHAVTAASDLYSLGASFFYLLTGKLLYDDQQYPTTVNKLRVIGQSAATLLQPYQSQLPTAVCSLLETLLDPNPLKRLSSASQLSEQVSSWASKSSLLDWSRGAHSLTPVVAPERIRMIRQHPRMITALVCSAVGLLSLPFIWPESRSDPVSSNAPFNASVAEVPPATTVGTESVALVPEPPKPLDRQTVSGVGRTTLNAGAIDFSAASNFKRNRSRVSSTTHSNKTQSP